MSNEVILNLSFDNQTVTDATENWTLSGTPNVTYEQISGGSGYSLVTGTLGTPPTLVAVDQEAIYNEYTIDFNLYAKPSYTDAGWFSFFNFNTGLNYGGNYKACVDNGLTINLEVGSSTNAMVTIDFPTNRWIHITIISEYDSDTEVYTAYFYVDSVLRTYKQGTRRNGSPFAIGKKLVLFNRGGSSFFLPNTPGLVIDNLTVIAGIHVPNQNPAISLFNLSRVFNNFCTWLKGKLSTVAFTGSYNDLSNKPTISIVNDGTLTIQQNGTNVQTFTANDSTNKTANIQCVDLSTAQTIGGQKTFTASPRVTKTFPDIALNIADCDVTEAPTEAKFATLFFRDKNNKNLAYITGQQRLDGSKRMCIRTHRTDNINNYYSVDLDSDGNFYPEQNNAINLGTPALQWNNAYIKSLTINGVACGDILTHNVSEFVNDADVVHVKGSDDIIDSKTFISLYTQSSGPSLWMKNTSFTMGTAPTTNRYSGIWVQDNNGTDTAYIVHQANKNNSQNLKFSVSNTDGTTVYQNALTFQGRLDGTFNFYSDNLANLGTPTNKWSKVYSDDVVHTTGSETIDGVKTFSSLVSKSNTLERGSLPTTNINEDPIFISVDKNNRRTLAFFNYYYPNGDGKVVLYTYNQNTTNYDNIGLVFSFSNQANIKSIYPSITETYNLGTSVNKWKSFNGINPGALSLPSTYVNVDTTNWVLDGSQPNHFVPTSDGWFGIQCTDTVYDQTHYVFVGRTGGGNTYYQQNVMSPVSALWDSKYHGCVFIPVIKNINYDIRCICSSITATFYPCQGNV